MKFPRPPFIWLTGIFISSLLLTFLFSTLFGRFIENFGSSLYRNISNKPTQHVETDSSGIPFVVFEGELGRQYNVVTIAEQALMWEDLKDTTARKIFFSCLSWLESNAKILNDSSIIFYANYDWPGYSMTAPWRSAMNQGRVMQVFIKAYDVTGDSSYLDLSRRAMNTLFTELKDGGVTYFDSIGYWYEEYADDNGPESKVLNGMIVVLEALSDFHKVTGDKDAEFLFEKGVAAVKNSLPLYDNNGHSNYDILGKPAKAWYHNFHIELLGFLYKETGDPIFNEYMQKWVAYKEPQYLTTLIRKPTNIGIFTVFSIFVAVFIVIYTGVYFFTRTSHPAPRTLQPPL